MIGTLFGSTRERQNNGTGNVILNNLYLWHDRFAFRVNHYRNFYQAGQKVTAIIISLTAIVVIFILAFVFMWHLVNTKKRDEYEIDSFKTYKENQFNLFRDQRVQDQLKKINGRKVR